MPKPTPILANAVQAVQAPPPAREVDKAVKAEMREFSASSHLQKLMDWLFGRDFFISYRWEDGRTFALALAKALKKEGFDCFLDSDGYLKGDDWRRVGERELRKTARLVLVGSPCVHKSEPVVRELKTFQSTGRRIFAVAFGDSLSPALYPTSPVLAELDPFILRHDEPASGLGAVPSVALLDELKRTFEGERALERRVHVTVGTAIILALLLVVSLALGGYAWWQRGEVRDKAQRAEASAKQAKQSEQQANLRRSDMNWQSAQLARGARFSAHGTSPIDAGWRLLAAAEAAEKAGDQRGRDNALLSARLACGHLRSTLVHGLIKRALPSPDHRHFLTWGNDSTLRLWNADDGSPAAPPLHDVAIENAAFSEDGKFLLTWYDKRLSLWKTDGMKLLGKSEELGDRVEEAFISDDGRRVLALVQNSPLHLWPTGEDGFAGQALRLEAEIYDDEKGPRRALLSPDGNSVLSWIEGGLAHLSNAADGRSLGEPFESGWASQREEGLPLMFKFSSDGRSLLHWEEHGNVWLRQISDSAVGRIITKHEGKVRGATFSPDGQRVLSWGEDGMARLSFLEEGTATKAGEQAMQEMKHNTAVVGASFETDGRRILSWSADGARLWDSKDFHLFCSPMRQQAPVMHAEISSDGSRILTFEKNGVTYLWDASDGTSFLRSMVQKDGCASAFFSASGQRVVTWQWFSTVSLWDTVDRRTEGLSSTPWEARSKAAYNARSQRVVVLSADTTSSYRASLFNATDGTQVGKPFSLQRGPSDWFLNPLLLREPQEVLFSADGKRLLCWSSEDALQLRLASNGEPTGRAMVHKGGINGALVFDKGRRILSWGADRAARMWSAVDGSPIGDAMPHAGPVQGAVVSPDGERIFSWCEAALSEGLYLTRVWNGQDGLPIALPVEHTAPVTGAVFSAMGQIILSKMEGDDAELWSAKDGSRIGRLQGGLAIEKAQFCADDQRVLGWDKKDRSARLWKVADGKLTDDEEIEGDFFQVHDQHILSWGGWKGSWNADFDAELDNVVDGTQVMIPLKHDDHVAWAKFSPDGGIILSTTKDEWKPLLQLWTAQNGRPLGKPMAHDHPVSEAHFSADGNEILSWDGDEKGSALRLWGASNGELMASYPYPGEIITASFDEESRHVCFVALTKADKTKERKKVFIVWQIEKAPAMSLKHHMLDFEVRSGTTIDDGVVRVLQTDLWTQKSAQWNAILREKKEAQSQPPSTSKTSAQNE